MTAEDGEKFLARWSRRKIEARGVEEKPAPPKPGATPPAQAAPAQPVSAKAGAPEGAGIQSGVAATPLPPLESLKGLASEYTEFLKPGVDEDLRRSALKKLFSDPHFENFERFEAYCEDYTQGEPIPLAMLKTLEHAKGLLFDEERKEEEQPAAKNGAESPRGPENAPEAPVQAKSEGPAVPAEPRKEA